MVALPSDANAHWLPGAPHWHINREASWYGPGFEGRPTACGETMRAATSWHVAALQDSLARCDLKVHICNRENRRCVNVTVQDSGGHRSQRRDWDLTPRVKRALRCPGLCDINWKKGW